MTREGQGEDEDEDEAEAGVDVDARIEVVADTGAVAVAGPMAEEDVAAVAEPPGVVSVAVRAALVSTSLPVESSRRRCRQSYSEAEADQGRDSLMDQRSRGSG